ncbi:TetR family transcriptional regulator [Micromonospora yangpuensis]|uniref:Transcriptional regulator, TetR family n=1 Tax=Micromonospora yangpuensis TaxID=683228 RepID=A0A1C6VFG5_9ACTN|nr:TetR/AcrR family transcriptional regulator [Micromonospora yangpuensis]GGM31629.1 TetR family transcriptional regulator [Micromonospora yangpuensis]SCL65029.1 transcriptional regulator, TetR family [Micromonospora yangpuensis]
MPTASSRVPQQERSRATRARLLAATVECLVEQGWSGTTTTGVAARAGVSRGAQLHHYPTRAALVTAAVAHLAERRADELRTEAQALPAGTQRLDRVVDLLGAAFTGPLFVAALELWVAARTDPELRAALVPLENQVGREMHRLTVELLGVDERRPGVREAVQATLDLLRGLGVANLLNDDSARRTALLHTWKRQLATLLTPGRPAGTMPAGTVPAGTMVDPTDAEHGEVAS